MEWISVKDKLPIRDDKYLVHAPSLDEKKPFIAIAWFDPANGGWSLLPDCWCKAITHWMELPKPPKTEVSNG